MISPTRDDYDSPWKEALEHYFPEFLTLLFPGIQKQIDWSQGHQFLDKELQQVVREAETGRRYADKLEREFKRDLIAFEEQANMPYITSVERLGHQEGHQEGRQEGRQEGEAMIVLRLITLKFGTPRDAVRQRIESADADTLLEWSERILTAQTIDDVLH